jgi:hypothetical protein
MSLLEMAACCSMSLSVMAACCSTPLSVMAAYATASDGRLLLDAAVGDGRLLLDTAVGDGRLQLDATWLGLASMQHGSGTRPSLVQTILDTVRLVWTAKVESARLGLGQAASATRPSMRPGSATRQHAFGQPLMRHGWGLGLGIDSLGHTAIDAARLGHTAMARPVWHTFGQPLTRYTIQVTPRPILLCWQAWNMVAASIWMGSSVATTDGTDFKFDSPLL